MSILQVTKVLCHFYQFYQKILCPSFSHVYMDVVIVGSRNSAVRVGFR